MKITITSNDGEVYDTFEVEYKHTRMGWQLKDSTGDPVTLDEALDDAAEWAEKEKQEVIQR